MTISKEELDAMFSSAPSDDEAPAIAPSFVAPDEPSQGTPSASPEAVVTFDTAPGFTGGAAPTAPAGDDDSWIDIALAEEKRAPDPMAEFDWLKRIKGFTAPYEHPKLGRVLAVGYYEVVDTGVRRWFNSQVDRVPFFDIEALAEVKRKTSSGRAFVKLLAWREGTSVRRWCRVEGSSRNAPGHDITFVVRGNELTEE